MVDRNDGSSSVIGQGETAEPGPSKVYASGERAANVAAEFVDAARSAAESLLEEQKQQVAEKVSGIAEALHSAARSLDQSQNRSRGRVLRGDGDPVMLSDESSLGPDSAAARPRSDRSVAALLSDLASETAVLVRQEIALFKAELHEKLARLGQGVGAVAAGGLV